MGLGAGLSAVTSPSGASAQANRLRSEGEKHLRALQAGLALEAFEKAALLAHSVDIELGIVRAHMQDGQFLRALNFAAHTAQAHRHDRRGALLYQQLLSLVGQSRLTPDSQQWRPFSQALPPSSKAIHFGSALLLPGEQHALISGAVLEGRRAVGLRHCRGFFSEARLVRFSSTSAVALLKILRPFARPSSPQNPVSINAKPVFAGSLAYQLVFDRSTMQKLSWPKLSSHFIERTQQHDLSIGAQNVSDAGIIFNQRGQVIGLGNPSQNNTSTSLLSVAACHDLLEIAGIGHQSNELNVSGANGNVSIEAVYQTGLNVLLQVNLPV